MGDDDRGEGIKLEAKEGAHGPRGQKVSLRSVSTLEMRLDQSADSVADGW